MKTLEDYLEDIFRNIRKNKLKKDIYSNYTGLVAKSWDDFYKALSEESRKLTPVESKKFIFLATYCIRKLLEPVAEHTRFSDYYRNKSDFEDCLNRCDFSETPKRYMEFLLTLAFPPYEHKDNQVFKILVHPSVFLVRRFIKRTYPEVLLNFNRLEKMILSKNIMEDVIENPLKYLKNNNPKYSKLSYEVLSEDFKGIFNCYTVLWHLIPFEDVPNSYRFDRYIAKNTLRNIYYRFANNLYFTIRMLHQGNFEGFLKKIKECEYCKEEWFKTIVNNFGKGNL